MEPIPLIKDFYNNEDILITGCTGLTGKPLVEKILRSCKGVSRIFVLIRELKDKTCQERLKELKESIVFDRIRRESPETLEKLVAINGDLAQIGLGLSEESIKQMKDVTTIFHVAATVRFDEPLKKSIILNIRGTHEICLFATTLKKLKIFVHVSTVYCNPYLAHVEEKIYPAKMNWKTLIKIAETMDDSFLNALTPKILGEFPNTYTFTKHLAEACVNEFRHRMTIAVVRPSVVHSAGVEPFPGWYDNYNGIMGLITGTYTGVVRGFYCKPNIVVDVIPLDDVVKLMIIASWWQLYKEKPKNDELSVYNLAASNFRSVSIEMMIYHSNQVSDEFSFNKCIWYPNFGATNNIYYFYYRIYMYHVLPAILIDLLLRLFKKQPFMLKIQRRALASQNVVRFFSTNSYTFQTQRTFCFLEEIKRQPDFEFGELKDKTLYEITKISLLGARRYLLNEDDSTIPQAKRRMKILYFVSRGIKGTFVFWAFYKLFNSYSDLFI